VGIRVELHLAGTRFETAGGGISYGQHYDPANTSFGSLIAHNDDLLAPGAGYDEHPHRDVDIISWVVSGALQHVDDLGSATVVTSGMVQRLSAGSGVRHAEHNTTAEAIRYLQMWIEPAVQGPPSYETETFAGTGFVTLVSGRSPVGLSLRAPASFAVARLGAGQVAAVDGSAFVHLSVVRGAVEFEAEGGPLALAEGGPVALADGDTARITGAARVVVRAGSDAEVLAWVMDG
jgi:redox-sensitive bicupin YhaK (pirin superfamily)